MSLRADVPAPRSGICDRVAAAVVLAHRRGRPRCGLGSVSARRFAGRGGGAAKGMPSPGNWGQPSLTITRGGVGIDCPATGSDLGGDLLRAGKPAWDYCRADEFVAVSAKPADHVQKESLHAAKQDRPDAAEARLAFICRQLALEFDRLCSSTRPGRRPIWRGVAAGSCAACGYWRPWRTVIGR
jgi:hypothetical protein